MKNEFIKKPRKMSLLRNHSDENRNLYANNNNIQVLEVLLIKSLCPIVTIWYVCILILSLFVSINLKPNNV